MGNDSSTPDSGRSGGSVTAAEHARSTANASSTAIASSAVHAGGGTAHAGGGGGTAHPGGGGVVVRSATLDDAEAIAHVHAASWRETYGRFVADPATDPWFDAGRRVPMWQANLSDGAFTTVVVAAGHDVVGFAAVRTADEDDAVRPEELTMLYLLADAHGSGAGQALLDAVLADRPASLWVAADNPRAHAFYRRNGFAPDGAESTFGPIGATVRLVR